MNNLLFRDQATGARAGRRLDRDIIETPIGRFEVDIRYVKGPRREVTGWFEHPRFPSVIVRANNHQSTLNLMKSQLSGVASPQWKRHLEVSVECTPHPFRKVLRTRPEHLFETTFGIEIVSNLVELATIGGVHCYRTIYQTRDGSGEPRVGPVIEGWPHDQAADQIGFTRLRTGYCMGRSKIHFGLIPLTKPMLRQHTRHLQNYQRLVQQMKQDTDMTQVLSALSDGWELASARLAAQNTKKGSTADGTPAKKTRSPASAKGRKKPARRPQLRRRSASAGKAVKGRARA